MTSHRRTAPGVSYRRRRLVLVICCLSLFIVGLDNTIVNVALPTIARGVHASVSGLQWIVDGYTMVLASLVMSAGAMADRFGRRRIFLTGLAIFTASSALCSVAPGLGWLVAFRVLQAIGGSMLNPVAVSIISSVYRNRAERAWAIGVWVSMFGVSMALGPVIGGILAGTAGWRSIFWVNIPVGLLAIILVARFIPESRAAAARRLDLTGQGLVIVMLASLVYAIIEGARTYWREPAIRGLFGLAGVALVLLVLWELRREDPLIDPRAFRNLPFTAAVLTGLCSFGALGGFLFLATIYLQDSRGLPALRAGVHMLPAAAAMAICPLLSARLADRRGLRAPLAVGGTALALSMAAMSRLTASSGDGYLVAAFIMFGVGLGMVDGQISHAAVSAMPASQAGVASGIASASRQMGQALGVAVTGAVLSANLHGPVRTGFVPASHPAWLVTTGCGCVVALLGLTAGLGRLPRGAALLAAAAAAGKQEIHPGYGGPPQPAPDPGPAPEPEWIPRYLMGRPASGSAAPATRSRFVITRSDQIYYRRRWRADKEQG
jgi:EmrB/QacA subfamily drug resistance transporter